MRMRSVLLAGFLLFVAASGWLTREHSAPPQSPDTEAAVADATTERILDQGLPAEAVDTLRSIEAGGPFPYDRDGSVFQNREGRLPAQPRGYYREYTVVTPGSPDRGARRIVSGGEPPAEFYYTEDHYRSFRRIEVTGR